MDFWGNILVVEEEPSLGGPLRRALRKNYQVEVAHSIRRAMEQIITSKQFDLIVFNLPACKESASGFSSALEEKLAGWGSKVVFIGSNYLFSKEPSSRETFYYLPDPLSPQELLTFIEEFLW